MSVGKLLYNTKGSAWWDLSGNDPDVTHWMPLPAPPKSDNAEAVERAANSERHQCSLDTLVDHDTYFSCNVCHNIFPAEDIVGD